MKEKIEQLIRDYHWMKKEVERLERVLFGYSTPMRLWGVAQYGDEFAMPKGSVGKSQAELRDMDIREERQYKRLKLLRRKVYVIESGADLLRDEKDKVIYDCMLDGMSYRAILIMWVYHVIKPEKSKKQY